MATLTEKEWNVEINEALTVDFYTELRNGIVNDIYAIVTLDGFHVTWSPLQAHGMIRVYEIGKLTNDWLRLQTLLGSNFESVEASLKSFLNENLTFNN